MDAFANPVIVGATGRTVVLARVPLGSGSDGGFSEHWLQSALYAHPKCLPVREIDPHIGVLVPICTEMETGAGPADIVYLTPTGQVVLVETKLWRNPKARRAVVGQVLDYAKQLSTWGYEDLARQAAIASKQGPDYLLARMQQALPSLNEAALVDGVNRSLKAGDFLLLIVGDGIRSGAEALVGFLERFGHLRFGLGLLEVAAFRLADGDMLLVPRILAKTEILQRNVLITTSGTVEVEQVAAVEDAEVKTSQAAWFSTFWTEYLEILRLDDAQQPKPKVAKSTNIFLSMPPGSSYAWVSAYVAQGVRQASVYLTFSKRFERARSFYEALLAEREDIEHVIGAKLDWSYIDEKVWIAAAQTRFSSLDDPAERQRVAGYLADMTNRFVNAFRHRLEALSRESKQ